MQRVPGVALRNTRTPAHRSTTRAGSSVPTTGHVHLADQFAGHPGRDRRQREAEADDDVERREGEDAVGARRVATAARPCPTRASTPPRRRTRSRPGTRATTVGARLNPGHDAAEHGDPDPRRVQRFDVGRAAAAAASPTDGADTEQRDQHAELGVARVQHLADEHDPEREQRSETAARPRSSRASPRARAGSRTRRGSAPVLGRPRPSTPVGGAARPVKPRDAARPTTRNDAASIEEHERVRRVRTAR